MRCGSRGRGATGAGKRSIRPKRSVPGRSCARPGRQPRILLTNVKQLELLLTRQQDIELFSDARLDFLVFDEAHTFRGALGAETACLIRRLASYLGMPELRSRVREDRSWFRGTAGAEAQPARPGPRLVTPPATARYVTCVPLVPLQAGAFSDPQSVPDESDWEWVEVDTARPLRPGMFVAQVVGKSMEPRIPDGAYCLFASPVTGTRQGRTVLVQLRDTVDPDTGQRFTVKRYRSEKAADEDGWRHVRIVLEPVNPDFEPIELATEDEDSIAVVAELVEVIGLDPPA